MQKVFIGVGHGGIDSGAIGLNKIYEKDLNLAIALVLNSELQRHGITTLMSRTKDENDPLTDEIRECNTFAPNLAIDVHNNAGGGDGFEAYYSVLNTVNGKASKLLAQAIEKEVITIGQNSRGCKTKLTSNGNDYFGFIRETRCPAVLVECAFVDTKDIEIIDEIHEQRAMGIALAKGVLKVLGVTYIAEDKPVPPVVETVPMGEYVRVIKERDNLVETLTKIKSLIKEVV